jgi:tetratricopeptide (TPR) repeat protein
MLAVVPASLPLRLTLGEAELKLGNAAEALSIANKLKAEYPDRSGGYLLEGDAQVATRRYSAAADSFAKAFAREATWPVLARLVGGLQLAGQSADALKTTEQWVAANPQHVQGTLTLALLLQETGRNEEALRAYESVLGRESGNLLALNNAAWLSNELGRPDALALAERARQLAPDSAPVLDTLGWILLAKKREQEAIAHLSRAAELAPHAPEIRYHFAKGLAAVGRSAEARSELTALLAEGVQFEHLSDARLLRDSL